MPTRLLPLLTSIGSDFSLPASWPTPIEARVVDDCGNNLTSGAVVASFSNGDAPLPLLSLRDGRWAATWQSRNVSQRQVSINLAARQPEQSLSGAIQISGALGGNANPPVIATRGVLNAASLVPGNFVAPGSLVTLLGTRLSEGQGQGSFPLDTQLAGTRVAIAGRALPLLYSSDGQVNALIPYDLPFNARHQLIIRRGNSLSTPETVTVAPALPAIFTLDGSGAGQGQIFVVAGDGSQTLVGKENPAKTGDSLLIVAGGLGAVDAVIEPGAAAPDSPSARAVNAISISIGGVDAPVSSAILAPGRGGVYQIAAKLPQGVEPGDSIPVTLTVAGQVSPAVSMSVR